MSAGMLFCVLWLIVGVAGLVYLLRRHIRWYWRLYITNRSLPPHQRWPEILQWQRGDKFEGGEHHCSRLVSITEDGYAVCEFLDDLTYVRLEELIGRNASARTRRISKRLVTSNEYMELLEEFNKAVAALEERDRKLRIAS